MKNLIRILIALVLAVSCVFACTSCAVFDGLKDIFGGNQDDANDDDNDSSGENNDDNKPKPPSGNIDTSDDYRIRFVYSYTAKIVNANDRTEFKKEVKTVDSIYIPRENSGFTADNLATINALNYHGFTFTEWFTEWDIENQCGVEGTEFSFDVTAIDKDITLYGSRGDTRADWLAGPNATYEIVEVYEDGTTSKMSDGTEESEEEVEEEEEKVVVDVILYIRGTGATFNFTSPNEIDVPWHDKAGVITSLVIEDGITEIGTNSFGNLSKLKNVTLPDSLTVIGESAFAGCTNAGFRTLKCPASLVSIERNAFNNTSLREVVLNEGLLYIKDNAFYKSNKIRSIVVPTTLVSVGNAAFHPGAVGSTNNSHALSKVYYKGDSVEGWQGIDVAMDNSWFAELPTIYYYTADETVGNDTTADIPYWHYADVNGVLTDTPAQYCYSIKYFLPSGSKLPFKTVYVPVQEKVVDGQLQFTEEGILILEGVITRDLVEQQNAIEYNGYKFVSFTPEASQIYEGMIINDDRSYTGVRGNILSYDGGIKWEFIGDESINEKGETVVSTSKGKVRVYKDETTEARIRADVLAKYTERFTDEEEAVIIAALDAEIAAGTFVLAGDNDAARKLARQAEIDLRVAAAADAIAAAVNAKLADTAIVEQMEAAVQERLAVAFRIWDFKDILDTGLLWNGAATSLGNIHTLIIEEGVEYIGKYAFNSLSGIKEVVLPNSLVGIHKTAFEASANLMAVLYNGKFADEKCEGLMALAEPYAVGPYTKLYELSTEASAAEGKFWTPVGDKKVTWEIEGTRIIIGGSDELPDFASPEAAPWYPAKDSITAVEFVSNVVSLGENYFTGYASLAEINLPIELRRLPASTFANTAATNDKSAFVNGLLLINGHLIKVDPAVVTGDMFETYYGILSIASGAFEGINISKLFVAGSIQYINEGAFPDASIKQVYFESGKSAWEMASADAGFASDLKVYYYSATEPVVDDPDTRYYYKSGSEYLVWGCDHEFGKWTVTTPPGCATEGVETCYCKYDRNHTKTRPVPPTGDHELGEWQVKTPATCTTHAVIIRGCTGWGCEYTEEKTAEEGDPFYGLADHVWGEYVTDNDGLTETATCENCTETNTRTKETTEE